MSATELWHLEEQFWIADAAFYQEHLATEALMVLPPPTGLLNRARALHSLHSGPRWTRVSFATRRLLRPAEHTAVLAYVVTAERDDEASRYQALCSSTYVRQSGQWKLLIHQQTPVQA